MSGFKKKIISTLLLVIILFFLTKTIIVNWSKIQDYQFDIKYGYLILSIIIIIVAISYIGILWNVILRHLGHRELTFYEAFKLNTTAWFGKYIPGKVGLIATKILLGKKKGIPTTILMISTIYENVFQVFSAFIVSVPILMFYLLKELNSTPIIYKFTGIFFLFLLLLIVHPRVFLILVNTGLKLFKKEQISKENILPSASIFKLIFSYSMAYILNGLAFYFFIKSTTTFPRENILPSIGIINFASVVGLLAIFAPAGIGVREGILVVLLKPFLPIEIVLFISIASRLWITIPDLILASYIIGDKMISKRIKKNRILKNISH